MPWIAAILASFGRSITDRLGLFLAQKALAVTLFMVVLPFILKGIVIWVFSSMFSVATNLVPEGTVQSTIISLSGVGAYLADCMQLPLCFSIIVSAVAVRFVLNLIPGVG